MSSRTAEIACSSVLMASSCAATTESVLLCADAALPEPALRPRLGGPRRYSRGVATAQQQRSSMTIKHAGFTPLLLIACKAGIRSFAIRRTGGKCYRKG
jgi:hypothetical protein